jgi:hypothetical protein
MVKDASNNWALNSAVGGLDSFKAYQSTNSGDTYIDASNTTGHIRLNYESGSGVETDIYSGSSANLVAAFLGPTSIKFPGLAASSGHFCLQVDSSGYLTNTGAACGSGSGSGGTSGTINSGSAGQIAYYTASGTTIGGMNAIPLASGGTGATSASGAVANLLPGVASDGNNGMIVTGNVKAAESIPALSPWCDIRSQGAVIDGATPIDSAVQACINIVNSKYGATGTVFLPCSGATGGLGWGCYLQNSSVLTGPSAGTVKFELQGDMLVGSTLVGYSWGSWFGVGGSSPGQFQLGTVPATILGPLCQGTLGTAITAANTAINITPTITGNVYGGGPACTIANFPVGSAITIAEIGSSSATATRILQPGGSYGQTTVTLASSTLRIPAGSIINLNCPGADTSFNVTAIGVSNSDYTAQTLTFFQADNTPAGPISGCTVTGPNQDKFESARVLCSNGVGGTFNGVTYNSCGANQVTIMTKHTHLASDQWGEVEAGPAFNTYNPQTWSDLTFTLSTGMAFWAEGSTNLTLNNIMAQASAYNTSGALELSANYLSQIHGGYFEALSPTPSSPCLNGGCQQPSNPYPLICDSDAAIGGYYSYLVSGCDSLTIDDSPWFAGGVLLTGDGVTTVQGLPARIADAHFEEVWGNLFTIDNRLGVQARNAMYLVNPYNQDNTSWESQPLLGYTDGNLPPTGAYKVENGDFVGQWLTNTYFNPISFADDFTQSAVRNFPPNLTGSSGCYNEGNLLACEIENVGAGFGPQILPYGSLPITDSVSSWSALCVSAGNCTVTAVVGPDGPNGKMAAAEMDTTVTGPANIVIGTDTRATYAGDHYIVGSYVRPGMNETITQGLIGGNIGQNNSFFIQGGGNDHYALGANAGTSTISCVPSAFGTQLENNGWGAQVMICTILTGDSTSHATNFYLTATNGGSGSLEVGNQYAEPFWTFIPGPNNPACTAAGTCNLSADQIEEARRDQYHGFVPPGMSAGTAATGETVSANGFKVNGTALNAPNETYNASASGSITLPSTDRAEATYVLSGNVTASIGAGTGGGKVTIFVCQPASGGPYTWTWPANWNGGVTVGTTASTCSEQTGTYIAGLGDWHGDAGSTNVPQ